MSRKRNIRDKKVKKVYVNSGVSEGLDIRDRNLLPNKGQWGDVTSPITGIKYRVLIGDIRRVR